MGWWFGRILTFEVEADEESPTVGLVISDASGGTISSEAAEPLLGFAAYGSSVRNAVEPLIDSYGVDLFDDGASLRSASANLPTAVGEDELGNGTDGESAARIYREQASARSLPSTLRLSFYDPDRDYQTGEARVVATEVVGNETRRELAAVLNAGDAKAVAQRMMRRAWAQRDMLRLRLPPGRLALEPGSRIELPLSPSEWLVEKVTIDGFVLVADMKPFVDDGPIAIAADGGRIVANSDITPGPVTIALLDIPALSPSSPTLLLAASSPTQSWKRAQVELSFSGQDMVVRTAARKSMLGSAVTILPAADPSSMDIANSVDVQLIDEDQWLTSCDDGALASGANLALIGGELIQFAEATPLGSGRFRLARLLRGRLDTEPTIPAHAIGDTFCLIEAGSLQSIALPVTIIGKAVSAQILGGSSSSLIVRPRADGIASPSGGATVHAEARTSIDQILATMRQHGLIEA